jgi:hypothetical protein
LKGFLKWYDGGRENGITSKKIFEVEVVSPLKILTSPLFEETIRGPFSFFSLSLFSFAPSIENSGGLMILEEKITSSKTSFQIT